jgi:hypothetical protein
VVEHFLWNVDYILSILIKPAIYIYSQVSDPSTDPGVNAYQFMLEQNVGKTMLQFQVNIKCLKGWNIQPCLSRS